MKYKNLNGCSHRDKNFLTFAVFLLNNKYLSSEFRFIIDLDILFQNICQLVLYTASKKQQNDFILIYDGSTIYFKKQQ